MFNVVSVVDSATLLQNKLNEVGLLCTTVNGNVLSVQELSKLFGGVFGEVLPREHPGGKHLAFKADFLGRDCTGC